MQDEVFRLRMTNVAQSGDADTIVELRKQLQAMEESQRVASKRAADAEKKVERLKTILETRNATVESLREEALNRQELTAFQRERIQTLEQQVLLLQQQVPAPPSSQKIDQFFPPSAKGGGTM